MTQEEQEIRERYKDISADSLARSERDFATLLSIIDSKDEEIERLREALEWYTDKKRTFGQIIDDGGAIARAALSINLEETTNGN